MRERGLKCVLFPQLVQGDGSLPVRERGLKWMIAVFLPELVWVAPCAGAWVEILSPSAHNTALGVAPCAGAWVEIVYPPMG